MLVKREPAVACRFRENGDYPFPVNVGGTQVAGFARGGHVTKISALARSGDSASGWPGSAACQTVMPSSSPSMATRKARHGWRHVSGVAVPQLPAAEGNAEVGRAVQHLRAPGARQMAHEVDPSQSCCDPAARCAELSRTGTRAPRGGGG